MAACKLSFAIGCIIAVMVSTAQAQNQTTEAAASELDQRASLPTSSFFFNLQSPLKPAANNAAATVFQMTAAANPLLATLPAPGVSVNRGEMQACAVLLPHVHPRATEVYYVLSGNFTAGLSEENGGRSIEHTVEMDQLFIVPQGLPHYMSNQECSPAEYLQIFNNIDPGLVTLSTAQASWQPFVLKAADSTAKAATLGAFGRDAACMARCSGSA